GQSISLGLLMGLMGTAVVFAILPAFLGMMALSPGANEQARKFLIPCLFGMPAMFLTNVLAAAFRGTGDTRTPLKVMILANIVHITLAALLIFGYLGLPALGLHGAGIALATSNVMAAIAYG